MAVHSSGALIWRTHMAHSSVALFLLNFSMHLANRYWIDFETDVLNKYSIEKKIFIWPLAVKVKVKIKFNASVKLLNIGLVYLAASTKSLYRIVFEISVLSCIKNLKFKMAIKSSNMADQQPEHIPNAHWCAVYICSVWSQFKENCRRRYILSAFISLYRRPNL